jgi:hypothetical protein
MSRRRCGDCQLCCRLLPTAEINKPALERCPHQKHGKGCAIYGHHPMSCQLWNCRWLVDESTADLPRPDRTHYVIDLIPDFITMAPHDGSPPTHIEVIQVWVDPAHKDAHRAPSFRRWLEAQGKPAIIRYDSKDGFILFPPSTNSDGRWVEYMDSKPGREHSLEEQAAALGGTLEIDLADDSGNSVAYHSTLKVGDKAIPVGTVPAAPERARELLESARRIREQRAAMIERAEGEP